MKRIILAIVLPTLLLSACAPKAAPTIDPAQIQASAMAAASTMIAMTQQAMPTDTPVPPTPLPSPTPLASPTTALLPTLPAFATPTTAASSGGSGNCNGPMDVSQAGPQAPALVNNNTKGPVTFTLYLGRKNSFGQCGYMSWPIPRGNSITVSVPYARLNQGDPCYWASAYVNDPKHPAQLGNGPFCLNNPDKWTFNISYDSIKLIAP